MSDLGTTLSQDAQQALTTIRTDAVKTFFPVLVNFFAQLKANGSIENATAKGLLVLPTLQAALPDFAQETIQDLAGQLEAETQSLVTSLAPAVAASQSAS